MCEVAVSRAAQIVIETLRDQFPIGRRVEALLFLVIAHSERQWFGAFRRLKTSALRGINSI
jgi:hypothetical protein